MAKQKRGGEVKKLGSLLEKYRNSIRAPQGTVITAFQEIVRQQTGVEVKKAVVSYNVRTKTLSVALAGPFKSEILLHKQKILQGLRDTLGERNAPDHIV